MQNRFSSWFTLIETLVAILIVSIVMIWAFRALSAVWIAKVKIIEKTEIEKQAYFAGEKFFELIKKWWTIDYEEYWNRYSYDTSYMSGHFLQASGFWNYGRWGVVETLSYGDAPYSCISNWGAVWDNGCLSDKNTSFDGGDQNIDYTWEPQRYTQYERQFIDRNSDNDNDLWDEDGDGNIIGDDDDLFLGVWPEAFSWSINKNKVGEIYLMNQQWNERTLFRWNVGLADTSDIAPGDICDFTDPEKPVGWACQWTLQMLRLSWRDYGHDHSIWSIDSDGSQYDGVIDTWIIHQDFSSTSSEIIAGVDAENYWQNVFPDSIHVRDVEFYVYPSKDLELSWRDPDLWVLIAPYLQISMTLQPSAKIKKKLIGQTPSVDITTTIQLTHLDIR